MKVNNFILEIIEHEVDKRFPRGIEMQAEIDGRFYLYRHGFIYKNGDNGLQLKELIIGIEKILSELKTINQSTNSKD